MSRLNANICLQALTFILLETHTLPLYVGWHFNLADTLGHIHIAYGFNLYCHADGKGIVTIARERYRYIELWWWYVDVLDIVDGTGRVSAFKTSLTGGTLAWTHVMGGMGYNIRISFLPHIPPPAAHNQGFVNLFASSSDLDICPHPPSPYICM